MARRSTFSPNDPATSAERERDRLRDDVYLFEQDFRQHHLWKIAVDTGVEQKLTDGPFSILWFHVSSDGTQILEQRAPTPLFEDLGRGETWITDSAGQHARQVTSNGIEEVDGELSPDNSQVLFTAEASTRLEPNYTWTLFTVPASGGTPTMTVPDLPYAIEHASWAPDSKTIFGLANMGVHNEIFRIDVASHTAKPLTDGRHGVQFWTVNQSARRMVFQFDEPDRLGDAWTLPIEGGTPTRVTGWYDSLASEYALPRQEKITWKGADGVAIEGILFYPIGYEAGKRYPLVVQLHTGPHESDKFGWGPGVLVNYVPVLTAQRLRGAAAELSRQRRLWQRVSSRRGPQLLQQHASRCDGWRGRGDPQRNRRSRSARGDGVERGRSPDEQTDHVHESFQSRLIVGRRGRLDFFSWRNRCARDSRGMVRRLPVEEGCDDRVRSGTIHR